MNKIKFIISALLACMLLISVVPFSFAENAEEFELDTATESTEETTEDSIISDNNSIVITTSMLENASSDIDLLSFHVEGYESEYYLAVKIENGTYTLYVYKIVNNVKKQATQGFLAKDSYEIDADYLPWTIIAESHDILITDAISGSPVSMFATTSNGEKYTITDCKVINGVIEDSEVENTTEDSTLNASATSGESSENNLEKKSNILTWILIGVAAVFFIAFVVVLVLLIISKRDYASLSDEKDKLEEIAVKLKNKNSKLNDTIVSLKSEYENRDRMAYSKPAKADPVAEYVPPVVVKSFYDKLLDSITESYRNSSPFSGVCTYGSLDEEKSRITSKPVIVQRENPNRSHYVIVNDPENGKVYFFLNPIIYNDRNKYNINNTFVKMSVDIPRTSGTTISAIPGELAKSDNAFEVASKFKLTLG